MNFQKDKSTEKKRYDRRAAQKLHLTASDSEEGSWLLALRPAFRPPYEVYFHWLEKLSQPSSRHLDLCCGDGRMAAMVTAKGLRCLADLSENSVRLAERNNRRHTERTFGVVADAEFLPFADDSFDLVTCAGSLSYFEPGKGALEIRRILKQGGFFICVDSLNHNWLYRFNRWVHRLLGKRTRSTLKRMPTQSTVENFSRQIGTVRHFSSHGILVFLEPILRLWVDPEGIRKLILDWDRKLSSFSHWSFKMAFVIQKDQNNSVS